MLDYHNSKSTKPVTVRINESVLKEIEGYGISYSDFIRNAINKELENLQKEKLINDYKAALEQSREESKSVNEEVFQASKVANKEE